MRPLAVHPAGRAWKWGWAAGEPAFRLRRVGSGDKGPVSSRGVGSGAGLPTAACWRGLGCGCWAVASSWEHPKGKSRVCPVHPRVCWKQHLQGVKKG